MVRLPAGGGPSETVAPVGKGEIALGLPQILPGGKAILFEAAVAFDPDKNTIEVLTLADHRRKIVARGGTTPLYLAVSGGFGHLIYLNKATLFAVPFDLDKLETRGTDAPVLDDVAFAPSTFTGQFNFSWGPSGHGTFVYRRGVGSASALTMLQWVDATGKKEPLRARPCAYQSP